MALNNNQQCFRHNVKILACTLTPDWHCVNAFKEMTWLKRFTCRGYYSILEKYIVYTWLPHNRVQFLKMAAISKLDLFLIDYESFTLYILGRKKLSILTVATWQWIYKHIFRAKHFFWWMLTDYASWFNATKNMNTFSSTIFPI